MPRSEMRSYGSDNFAKVWATMGKLNLRGLTIKSSA